MRKRSRKECPPWQTIVRIERANNYPSKHKNFAPSHQQETSCTVNTFFEGKMNKEMKTRGTPWEVANNLKTIINHRKNEITSRFDRKAYIGYI